MNYLDTLNRPFRKGWVSLFRDKGMTPWHFSTERAHGLWSLSMHGFGFQLNIIGPFVLKGS